MVPFVHEGHKWHEDLKDETFPFQFGMTAEVDQDTHLHPRGFEIVEELGFLLAA
jgi:hypothetical protein